MLKVVIGVLIGLVIIGVIIILLLPEPKFKYTFNKKGLMIIKHPIKIKTTPEKMWGFLADIEKNYIPWHPDDHVSFVWTKGEPWSRGSKIYSEQYMGGQLVKYKGLVTESILQNKVTFTFMFPISIINPKNEFIIHEDGQYTIFTGVTYLKFNKLFRIIFKKQIEEMIESVEKHTTVENENMKKILESKY